MDSQGELQTSHRGISDIAVAFYEDLLGKDQVVGDIPEGLALPTLSESHRQHLEAPFSMADILKCFKSMAKNKSPGPDGFPTEFFVQT